MFKSLFVHVQKNIHLCRNLAMQDQFKDLKSKIVLLNFSLTHCPPEEIQQILKERSVLEVEVCRIAWIFLS